MQHSVNDSREQAVGRCLIALGGVWLDEIRKEGEKVHENVVGGSVTFTTLGARLFISERRSSIGMVLKKTPDFPEEVIHELEHWRVDLKIVPRGDVPAARGVVHYGSSESERFYERLTSPLNTCPDDLDSSDLLHAQCFHFFDVPATLLASTEKISSARRIYGVKDPLIIWEPQAKSCSPETLDEHLTAARSVDIFSPNHMELASFFGTTHDVEMERTVVEKYASCFVRSGIGSSNGCAVVRCAEHGCLVTSRWCTPTWLPAYYEANSEKIVDTTGAGNAFLGGFAIGFQESGSYVEAAKYGAVAASFVLEQVGPPKVEYTGSMELWNGASVQQRLQEYRQRCQDL